MAIAYSHYNPPISGYSPYPNPASISLNPRAPNCAAKSLIPADSLAGRWKSRRSSIVVAIGNGGYRGSLGAPLEPTSTLGESLCDVLLNDPYSFYDAVSAELTDLAEDRDNAFDRMELSFGDPEACLHRRIGELKEAEQFPIIEDIIYMIIYKKFKDIKVPLIPSIDKCICKCKLEISPSNDKELKSIHGPEEMEVIKEYLTNVLESNASVNSDPITIKRLHLSRIYSTSIFYGYFLKSVSLRHRLDRSMSKSYLDILPLNSWPFLFGSGFYGLRNIALGEFSTTKSTTMSRIQSLKSKPPKKLKNYVQGLDQDGFRVCKEMRSQVSLFLVQDHCLGLFAAGDSFSLFYNDSFLISLPSLKSLALEAIAFGCFLWDAEEYVDRVFNLRKNMKSLRMV